jgi:CubicO group peptidase (beta-lactamase class C family)
MKPLTTPSPPPTSRWSAVSPLQDLTQFTDDGLSYTYPNLRSQALRLQPDGAPVGTYFNYNNYYPQLLGMILERTTHRPVAEYLQEKIWKPLGMEYPASWSLDSEASSFELMTAGINGRAIDFARFGRLFLNHGAWGSQQIISAAWVVESTAPDPHDQRPWRSERSENVWPERNGYYKYLWWGTHNLDGSYTADSHALAARQTRTRFAANFQAYVSLLSRQACRAACIA